MAAPRGDADRTRHGLITLIALRQAKAMRERREREASAPPPAAETPPKRRGWFR